jgi:hypothetical protein
MGFYLPSESGEKLTLDSAAAAAVPDPAAGNNIANMFGRLREFLTQIEQNFPAVPPAANAENNEDNIDENLDEFD